jgi:hypothetical protein
VQCSGVIVKMKICGECREGKDAWSYRTSWNTREE